MSEILKVKVQDENGNVFYIHTSADVVFCADGTSVQDRLGQKIDKSAIIQNATTEATDKVPSAAVAKNLQDQLNQLNTNIIKNVKMEHDSLYTKDSNYVNKRGNAVHLNLIIYSTGAMPKNSRLFNVPDDCRPKQPIHNFPCIIGNTGSDRKSLAILTLGTTGNASVYYDSDEYFDAIYINLSYLTGDF